MYGDLTAELKNKFGVKAKENDKLPILLPPKDYDTIHRNAGNLDNIETRRSQTANIIAVPGGTESSHSSGSGGNGIKGQKNRPYAYDPPISREDTKAAYGQAKDVEYSMGRKGHHEKNDPDIKHVTPRWKSHGDYHPPPTSSMPNVSQHANPITQQQRPISPAVNAGPYGRKDRALSPTRAKSPVRMGVGPPPTSGRPLSPPPDLRGESYFRSEDPLPGYLPGAGPPQHTQYGTAPTRGNLREGNHREGNHREGNHREAHHDRQGIDPMYGSNGADLDVYSGGKKYTASTLGLLDRGNKQQHRQQHGGPASGRTDEGYTSMDRQNPYGDYQSMDRGRPGYGNRTQPPGKYDPRAGYQPSGPADQPAGNPIYGKMPAPPKHHKHHEVYQSEFAPYNEATRPSNMPADYTLSGLGYYP